jgi:hypothetical protein
MLDSSLEAGLLVFITRSMAAAERGLHRAITTLRLQADRGFVPSKTVQPSTAYGFVPGKTTQSRVAPGFVSSKNAEADHASSANTEEQTAPPQHPPDFGVVDVQKFLAQFDDDLHPYVLEDLELFQRLRKSTNPAPYAHNSTPATP